MKKLLSLLSVLTISGSAVPTTIAASPYQKQETIKNIVINYQQRHNLDNLKRFKRDNENMLRVKYKFLGSDWLFAKISHLTWQDFVFKNSSLKSINQEFENYVFSILKTFQDENDSGARGDLLPEKDIHTITTVIVTHFDNINNVYKNKKDDNLGIILRTNRESYWENNGDWWGAHINTFGYDVWE